MKPIVWVIVDDNSDDASSDLINDAICKHPWIHCLTLNEKCGYDLEEHYADVCRRGFNYALKITSTLNYSYSYIGLSDADMIYPKDYFCRLISFLDDNIEYGLVCGNLFIWDVNGNHYNISCSNGKNVSVSGTGRLWRVEAFDESEGYLKVKSPDSVSNIKLLLRGWKIKRLEDVVYYQTRETGDKINIFYGYYNRGKRAYYLNANILSVINTLLYILTSCEKYKLKKCLSYFSGYIYSFLKRSDKISDIEVKKYNGSYKRVLYSYLDYVKKP